MKALPSIKIRAKTLNNLSDLSKLYTENYKIQLDDEQIKIIKPDYCAMVQSLIKDLELATIIDNNSVKIILKSVSDKYEEKFGNFMKIVR